MRNKQFPLGIVIQLEPIIEDENDDTITLLCKRNKNWRLN